MFKQCSKCNYIWETQNDFLSDPNVELVGYQVHFDNLKAGLLMFNHNCGTTMAFTVEDFQTLYQGPVFKECKRETNECPNYCLKQSNLKACPTKCECSFVREIIQIIKNWPKKGS